MTQVEGDGKGPWWEDDGTLVFVILGLPVVGLTVIGVLSLSGINTSDFPQMISAEFFVTDLFVKLLTLPIGFIAIRAFLRSFIQKHPHFVAPVREILTRSDWNTQKKVSLIVQLFNFQ